MKKEIQEQVKQGMKAGNKLAVQTLRALLSAMQYEEMQKGVEELPASDFIAIVKNEIKKRREALEFAEKAARTEQVDEIKQELACLEAFLPKQLSREEIADLLKQFKNQNPDSNMGLAMKDLKDKFIGQYDGKLASELAKEIFS